MSSSGAGTWRLSRSGSATEPIAFYSRSPVLMRRPFGVGAKNWPPHWLTSRRTASASLVVVGHPWKKNAANSFHARGPGRTRNSWRPDEHPEVGAQQSSDVERSLERGWPRAQSTHRWPAAAQVGLFAARQQQTTRSSIEPPRP